MEEHPKTETSVERWRAVTADVLRPVPYTPGAGPAAAPPPVAKENPNFAAALLRGKWLLVAMALLGSIYGAYRVIAQVPMYAASTTLELMTPNATFMGQGRFDTQGADFYAVNQANLQTQLRIIQGPALLRRARDRVTLESPPINPPAGGILSDLRNRLKLVPQENMDFLHAAINVAAHTVAPRQVGTTKLIEVSCQSYSAETAAAYINALASEYINQSQQSRSSNTTRTMQWLSTQLEDAKSRMDEADQKLQDFLKTGGRAFVLERSTLDDSKLSELQAQLAVSQNDRITKQSRYELAKSSPIDSLPEILDDGTLKTLSAKQSSLRETRAELIATITPENVKVQRIDAQIAGIQQEMLTEKANLVKRIENEYQEALRREKLLNDAYNKQSNAVAGQTDKAYQFNNLKRTADTERSLYNSLQTQYNEMNVIAAVPSSSARVIDAATPIYRPVKPQPVRDMLTGIFGGIAFGAIFLALREMILAKKRSRVFAAPGASHLVLNVPELGILPAFEHNGATPNEPRFSLRIGRDRPEEEASQGPTSWSKEPFLAESIRHAFASIRARNNDGGHRLFVVTSASPSEGKTTLIGNLAVAMAEAGQRVLMVDADLRAPRLASLFRLNGKEGLSEIYRSSTPIEDVVLDQYVRSADIPNLHLLASGEGDAKTAGELPFSRRIRELFARLRKNYDYVLIDTPPSIQFSDARLLGQISDGVILVIRSGVSSREAVSLTVKRFADDGVPIIGTILNHWQPVRGAADYGGYYANGYKSPYNYSPKA